MPAWRRSGKKVKEDRDAEENDMASRLQLEIGK